MAIRDDRGDRPTSSGDFAWHPTAKVTRKQLLIFHEHDVAGLSDVWGKGERKSGGLNNHRLTMLTGERLISEKRQIPVRMDRHIAELRGGGFFARQTVELGGQGIGDICPDGPCTARGAPNEEEQRATARRGLTVRRDATGIVESEQGVQMKIWCAQVSLAAGNRA
jgi:hypothetical protein